MPDDPTAPDLGALHDSYEIHGELRDSETARRYVARRRAGGADVVLSILTPPKGASNNELAHFAADVKLLSALSYPGIARVYETRWLAPDVLAVAGERVQGSTLNEAIERGETFSNPRIALILREVYAALDWARAQGVVHRGVAPDTLYFEPRSERPVVALAPTPIPIGGVPDARADARTIGALAWTMLTGRRYEVVVPDVDGEETPQPTLAEIAPNLATRVVDATEKMLHWPDTGAAPDVPTFLGIIAAGDVLKRAEVEIAATKELYEEEHRLEIERYEMERREVEQRAAEQATALAQDRAALEHQIAERSAALDAERARFERSTAERQAQLKEVRHQLAQQAAELERRLTVFDERRREFELFRDERVREMAEARAADTEYEGEEFVLTPDEVDELRQRGEVGGLRSILDDSGAAVDAVAGRPARPWRTAAIAGGGALILAALVAGARYENAKFRPPTSLSVGSTTVVPTARPIGEADLPRAGFLSQRSAAGTLAARGSGPPLTRSFDTIPDSVRLRATADTLSQPVSKPSRPKTEPRPEPRREIVREPRSEQAPRREAANDVNGMVPASIFALPSRDSARRDSVRRDSVRRDSVRRDSVRRRDSLLRRDTLFRRDTTRPRPDTLGVRPDTLRMSLAR